MLCPDFYLFSPVVLCLAAFSLLPPGRVLCQSDTIVQLREIEITAQRIDLTEIGKHTDHLDSIALATGHHENLASLLQRNTPLFIRTYGNGTLATLGIRGGSAAHTQLLWNGIPLRNPMLGMVDLALIPSSFLDEAAVHYGGHGAAFGSGAIGGLIALSNKTVSQKNGLELHLAAGSWDKRTAELKLNYGGGSIRVSTRLFSLYSENNYRYRLDRGLPERNQVHHRLKNNGILQEVVWTMNERHRLTGRLWYQTTDRQIPPTSTQNTSRAAQQDENLRVSLQWQRHGEKFNWQLKSAWLDEVIDYQDSLILLYTQNRFQTWLAEGETSFRLGRDYTIAAGVYVEAVQASSANYLSGTSRHQEAVFATLRYHRDDWLWRFQIREEITDDTWSPLLMDLSAEWYGITPITLKTSVSRNYRTPTLNDLYWRPGGNPDLVPEQGWTVEAGLDYKISGRKGRLISSLTGYVRNMDQWIMWMPPIKDVRNYWSPVNITEVHSKGIEARGDFDFTVSGWKVQLTSGFDMTWSTFGTPLPDFRIEEGDQLFYIPVENALTGVRIHFRDWVGSYQHHWYGPASGINEDVKAGNVATGSISRHLPFGKWKGYLYLQAENVWNVPYRIIERRPMPGRSFTGGFKLSISG